MVSPVFGCASPARRTSPLTWRSRQHPDLDGYHISTQCETRPSCERCGCPPPATGLVAQRCPSVVDPLCRKPSSDDIDAVQRKHRNEQMALDPLAQLVPARAQPLFGFERPECGFQFSQSPAPLKQLIFLREDLRHRQIVRFVPPPSSRMFCPTIKPDCCEHRNAHAAPNSCRVP